MRKMNARKHCSGLFRWKITRPKNKFSDGKSWIFLHQLFVESPLADCSLTRGANSGTAAAQPQVCCTNNKFVSNRFFIIEFYHESKLFPAGMVLLCWVALPLICDASGLFFALFPYFWICSSLGNALERSKYAKLKYEVVKFLVKNSVIHSWALVLAAWNLVANCVG